MNAKNPGRNQGSFTQHRLSLKGCSPAEPLSVSPDASNINNDLEFQLSRSLFLSNEWGVELWIIDASVLIDSENKIKMVGAPWANADMTELFYKTVNSHQ